MKSDVTKFCFCEMFQIIMEDKDSKFVATTIIDDCKVKFYNSQGVVHVIYLDENGYEVLEAGNFYDMYCTSDNLVLADLITAKFTIVDIRKQLRQKEEEWIPCDFRKACSTYDSGGMIRIEKSMGVLEHYSKIRCEFAEPYSVMDFKLEGYEYKI